MVMRHTHRTAAPTTARRGHQLRIDEAFPPGTTDQLESMGSTFPVIPSINLKGRNHDNEGNYMTLSIAKAMRLSSKKTGTRLASQRRSTDILCRLLRWARHAHRRVSDAERLKAPIAAALHDAWLRVSPYGPSATLCANYVGSSLLVDVWELKSTVL